MAVTVAPYGTWSSPVTPELISATGSRVRSPESVEPAGQGICWLEQVPADGRTTLLYRGPDGSVAELTPSPFSAESRVQEHGGRCYTVADGVIFFSNGQDRRLYRRDPDGSMHALTPELDVRYTEPVVDARRQLLYCVMEDHRPDGEPASSIVAVPTAGGSPVMVASGHDFYGSPRLSPDASKLAWVCWDHPNMPWDGTELWVAGLGESGLTYSGQVAGNAHQAALFPRWSPEGELYFLSDRSGYSNLYRLDSQGPTALGPEGVDCAEGLPLPLFNGGYDFLPDGRIFFVLARDGSDSLALLDPASGQVTEIATPFTYFPEVRTAAGRALVIAAGPDHLRTVALISPDGATEVVARSPGARLDPRFNPRPMTLTFPTTDGASAHAFLYLPANPGFEGLPGELPPLVVNAHGGPIGSTHPVRSLDIQLFTSRGIAFLDVNYRGSRGYGRAYREALYGRWGEADVDDCIAAARYVAGQGLADPARIIIRGGSAGGYTVLASLAFRDFYTAGISRFGLSDLERFMLPGGTHKFESRYNIHLVGPYPEAADRYRARSPVHHAERITVPVLLMQGSEDKVVPPEQTRGIAERLRALGRPAFVEEFAGEGHGFRRKDSLLRAFSAELAFVASIFGTRPAEGSPDQVSATAEQA
jgi:dipeptidyl aminopeptidase/acylaminoacyl peptidase